MDRQSLFDVVLRPLSRRTIRRILEKEFPRDIIQQETIDTVCAISRGNPFLLWKIIQYVHDSGTQNLSLLISNMKDNSFMGSMLDNLSPSHCAVLKIASVIGEEFSKDILEAVVPTELKSQLLSALQNLENRGLVATLFDGYHTFSSSLIRKFVYDLIPPRLVSFPLPICRSVLKRSLVMLKQCIAILLSR
jgi:predicted ATPase